MHVSPTLDRPSKGAYRFDGFVGGRLRAAIDGWLLPAAHANPAMLQVFRDRDRSPRRKLLPWAGEFVGKHLTAAALVFEVTQEPRLAAEALALVRELREVQDTDGYLGPHPRSERLTGKTVDGHAMWDVWGHYHCLVGLLLWDRLHPGSGALETARRAADRICATFLDGSVPLGKAGAEEMNMAIAHGMALLHDRTGEARYLEMALRAVLDWGSPPAGDYLRQGLAGTPFHRTPKPRWESLHDLLALSELYWITGDGRYRRAFEHFWWSILEGDRHNTGGFTSGEQAVGNPYATGAIETCCTVAWIVMSVGMLRLTGDSRVADEIELSTLNGGMGGQHPSGRWWTYNTPMDGVKLASAHEIVFQAHAGGPELNCCSVNGPRSLGMLAEWALLRAADGPALSYYGPGELSAEVSAGNRLRLVQKTEYPGDGAVRIEVGLDWPARFNLRLRIPQWSERTHVAVNGEPQAARPGTFLELDRAWRSGDRIDLELDMRLHFWAGEREQQGKTCLYRGPVLLAYDQRYNSLDPEELPALTAGKLTAKPATAPAAMPPWLLYEVTGTDGRPLVLCDFASAGAAGTQYRSWLKIDGVSPRPFTREQAIWAGRPSG